MEPGAQTLRDRDAFVTTVAAVLFHKYGLEFVNWDPTTCLLQVRDDFHFEPEAWLGDKIQTVSTLISTTGFHTSFTVFNALSRVLSGDSLLAGQFVPADLEDCAWACVEARLLEGPAYKDTKFSPEIASFVGFLLEQEGLASPPSVLSFAIYADDFNNTARDNAAVNTDLYKVYLAEQESKRAALEQGLKQRLAQLMAELMRLPFEDTNKDLLIKLLKQTQEP